MAWPASADRRQLWRFVAVRSKHAQLLALYPQGRAVPVPHGGTTGYNTVTVRTHERRHRAAHLPNATPSPPVAVGVGARPLRVGALRGTLVVTPSFGGDAMAKSLVAAAGPRRAAGTRRGSSASPERPSPARAGQIGPIRREIIFEPVHEQPAPVEPAPVEPRPVAPDRRPREPVPDGS